jgi:Zn-dependent protease
MDRFLSTPDEGLFQGRVNEWVELLKAWGGTTLAYAIFWAGAQNLVSGEFVRALILAAITCGLGFVLHELAHRAVARNFGAQAHFAADNRWLLLSIVIAFAGIFIAAPGAVWHRGFLSPRQSGLIALAGPVTNFIVAGVFLILLPLMAIAGVDRVFLQDWLLPLCVIGFRLNAWLGLFNMLPAGPFDGAKVLAWSPLWFGVTVVVGIVLSFVVAPNLGVIWPFLLRLV